MKKLLSLILAAALIVSVLPAMTGAAERSGLSAQLVAEYNFNDQSTNDCVGGYHATLYNNASPAAATYVDGVSGKALQLSSKGTDEKFWLSVPYAAFGSCRDSFTLSLWYKASGYNTSGEDSELFSFYNSSAEKFLYYSPAAAAFQDKAFTMKWDGTYGYANVITPYAADQWVNLVYAVSGSGSKSSITAYINGAAVEVDQGGEWTDSLMSLMGMDTFTIGGKNPYKGGGTPSCLFYGAVDEIRLYNGVLNASDAAEIYASGTVPTEPADDPKDKLLAEYNFNDHTTADRLGKNDATLYNSDTVADGAYVQGVSGTALKLSSVGGSDKFWLSIPYAAFGTNTDSFTLSLWYKASGYNTSGEDSELFSFYNSGAEKFLYYSPAAAAFQDKAFTMKWDGTYGYANVVTPYAADTWVHLVYAVSNDNGKSVITAYINGALAETDQGGEWSSSLMSLLGIDTFTIGGKNPYKGGNTPSCLFYGAVDEIRLYAGALSAEEAAKIYAEAGQGGTGSDRGTLLAEYNFDDKTTADSVGTNDAALYDNASAAEGTYVKGVSGTALKLSVKGDSAKYWLSIPYAAFGKNTDSFTLSLWYKPSGYNTAGEDSELFSFYNSSAEKFLYYSPASAAFQDKAFTMKWDGTYGYANVMTPYAASKWVHLVYIVDANGNESKITAYLNGAAVEVDQGGNWSSSLMSLLGIDSFTIGGKNPYKGGDTPSCLFYGSVDEIRLYAGALTAEEAAALFRSAAYDGSADGEDETEPIVTHKMLAEYNFNKGTTEDSVGGINASLYDNETAAAGTYVKGVVGKALQLSRRGEAERLWLSIPYRVFGSYQNSFTLSIWYKANGYNVSGEDSELFSLYNSSAEKFLYYSPAAAAFQDKAFTMKWDGSYGYANVLTPYAENKWKHLVYAVSRNGNQTVISAYLDGEAVTVDQGGNWSGSLMTLLGMDTFTIGGKNPYKGGTTPRCLFYGQVDEIRLYSGVLTAAEAKAIYTEANYDGSADGAGSGTGTTLRHTLLAEYNFNNETTNDTAGSHNASLYNDDTLTGGKYITGVVGKALQLSTKGAGDKLWLSIPYSVFGKSRNTFSLSLWYAAVGYNTSGEDSELFSLYNSGAERFLFYSPASTAFQDKGFTMKWDNSYGYANVIKRYTGGEWVHLVYVVSYEGSRSVITAYVNGQEVEVDQGGDWRSSLMSTLGMDTFTIGGKNPYKGGETPSCLFYGAVDEIQLYAGALTQGEAELLYRAANRSGAYASMSSPYASGGASATETGNGVLVAAYNFNDKTTKDSVGKYDATLYDNDTAADGTYVAGIAGKALQLSTKGESEKFWLSIPYEALKESPDSFSLSIWYRASGYNTTGEDSELFSLYNRSQEKFLFYAPAATAFQDKGFTMKWDNTYGYANVITPYAQDTWVHLVYVVAADGKKSRITAYVNGKAVEVDQGDNWADSLMSILGVDTLTIGGKNPYKGGPVPSCLFYGAVDEIQLYTGTLTQADAERLYNQALNYVSDGDDDAEKETEAVTAETTQDTNADRETQTSEESRVTFRELAGWLIAAAVVLAGGVFGLLSFLKKRKKTAVSDGEAIEDEAQQEADHE